MESFAVFVRKVVQKDDSVKKLLTALCDMTKFIVRLSPSAIKNPKIHSKEEKDMKGYHLSIYRHGRTKANDEGNYIGSTD